MISKWHVDIPFGESGVYVSDADTSLVCRVWPIGGLQDAALATERARLIAAAPELLDLLRRAVGDPSRDWVLDSIELIRKIGATK